MSVVEEEENDVVSGTSLFRHRTEIPCSFGVQNDLKTPWECSQGVSGKNQKSSKMTHLRSKLRVLGPDSLILDPSKVYRNGTMMSNWSTIVPQRGQQVHHRYT